MNEKMASESENKEYDQDRYNKNLDNTGQYLSFTLGNEEYGVDILRVQEIRSWEPVSRIPNVPIYEKGVVNLRGSIVPIIDLRERFKLKSADYTLLTVVVVLQTGDSKKHERWVLLLTRFLMLSVSILIKFKMLLISEQRLAMNSLTVWCLSMSVWSCY